MDRFENCVNGGINLFVENCEINFELGGADRFDLGKDLATLMAAAARLFFT